MWDKLKERWKVRTGWDVAIILVVFACTGFSVMYSKRYLYTLLGITAETTAWWIRVLITVVVILPFYQVLLLVWGWIFGKFDFFWEFEKRMFSRIGSLFRKK